jgi:hypothetical protein
MDQRLQLAGVSWRRKAEPFADCGDGAAGAIPDRRRGGHGSWDS